MAERAVRSAARRRERWLRSMWRHEQLSVRMAVATASHHSWKSHAVVGTQTEYAGVAGPVPVTEYVAPAHAVAPFSSPAVSFEMPAPVVEYVAHAPAVTYAAPALVVGYVSSAPAVTFAAHAPVIDYVAPASSVTYAAPAPVFEYVVPAPVLEYIAPAPAVSFIAPSQQLRTAYTATGVNLDAAVEVSASQVVGSLPLGEVFAAPVFHQVHHEQRAGGDTTEIFANFPVVQEQGVVGSLPPVEEFTAYVARRPSPLVEVRPSVRVQRHVVEQLADIAPMVQILDSPEPQMVAQLLEVFRLLDTQLPDEQAILVPKFSCSPCPSRSRVPEPQSADQLVEVPTVLTPTRIALQIAEQIVDTPLEEDEDSSDELLEYFCEDCVFLEVWNYEWQSLGSGVARLVRQHSDGAVFFQFWQSERLIIADFVHPQIVLRPARGGGGCIFTWSDPVFAGGPSDYLHAVRFASQELGRRFHDAWAATG